MRWVRCGQQRFNSQNSSAHVVVLSVGEESKNFVAVRWNASGTQQRNTILRTVVLGEARKHQQARNRRREAKNNMAGL